MVDNSPHNPSLDLFQSKAENLYAARDMCCSQAIMLLLNDGFGGGLEQETVIGLSAGFCGGMGDAGCACGALTGSIMGLGLFLGPQRSDGLSKKEFRGVTKRLHDQFLHRFGSTCCRILIKDFEKKRKQHREFCKKLTGETASMVCGLLIDVRPELINKINGNFLHNLDSRLTGILKRLF